MTPSPVGIKDSCAPGASGCKVDSKSLASRFFRCCFAPPSGQNLQGHFQSSFSVILLEAFNFCHLSQF